MDTYTLLTIGHLVGTVLGVGGATMIEVHLNKALQNGDMSSDERGMLGLNFTVLRVGLVLSILTGVGFILYYISVGNEFRLQSPVFWAKMLMIVVITVNALLLQAHKINLYWGSALSFVTWWAAMLMGIFTTESVSANFFVIIGVYAVSVVLGAFVLHKIRERIKANYIPKDV